MFIFDVDVSYFPYIVTVRKTLFLAFVIMASRRINYDRGRYFACGADGLKAYLKPNGLLYDIKEVLI